MGERRKTKEKRTERRRQRQRRWRFGQEKRLEQERRHGCELGWRDECGGERRRGWQRQHPAALGHHGGCRAGGKRKKPSCGRRARHRTRRPHHELLPRWSGA